MHTQIAQYRVVRPLGEGGMGAVYEGADALGRPVAIKVLLPHYSAQPEVVARFFNEARACMGWEHPGIVKVYDTGQLTDGTAYLVMEYLNGQSLGALLKATGGRGLGPRALELCRQVAEALVAAHQRGVIHRDLKPDNVMLVSDERGGERCKVLDFGIAKVAHDSELAAGMNAVRTKTGMVLGTPAYMSPEQVRGQGGITGKADVYSLGAMLYHLVSGQAPFNATGLGEILAMHIYETAKPLADVVPGVPRHVSQLVARMLEKAPEARPTMAEVAQALAPHASGGAATLVGTRTTIGLSAGEVLGQPPAGRGGRVALVAGILVGLAAVGVGGGVYFARQQGASTTPTTGPAAPTTAGPSSPTTGGATNPTGSPTGTAGGPATAGTPAATAKRGKVLLVVKSEPTGAEVIVPDGTVVGRTPFVGEEERRDGSLVLTLRKPGYADKQLSLDLRNDQSVKTTLVPTKHSGHPAQPDDYIAPVR